MDGYRGTTNQRSTQNQPRLVNSLPGFLESSHLHNVEMGNASVEAGWARHSGRAGESTEHDGAHGVTRRRR